MTRFAPKPKSEELNSLAEYVALASPDAMRWTYAGIEGLRRSQIPYWITACRRRYAEERDALHAVDVGGEA